MRGQTRVKTKRDLYHWQSAAMVHVSKTLLGS